MSKTNKKIKEKSEMEKSNLKVILENCSGNLLNSNKEPQIKSAGITLIALVLTIVILIILATITINFAFGENGLVSITEDARDITTETTEKENLEESLRSQFGNDANFTVTENGDGSFLINMNDSQRSYYVESTGEILAQSEMIEIGTAEELKAFRDEVNSGNTFEGKYIRLTNNITLDIGEEWEPIGYYSQESTDPNEEVNKPFQGTFDGQFYTISGIYTNSNLKNRGLFGLIKNATIKNLGINDSNIQGESRTGAIVGYGYDKSVIMNCYNLADIRGIDNFIGGIAGFIKDGTIINSFNIGNINTTKDNVGGIVGGIEDSSIKNCYNMGTIVGNYVGGISGRVYNKAIIENCYNVGVLETSEYAKSINGSDNSNVTLKNNYYLENTVNGSNDTILQRECTVKNIQEMKSLAPALGAAFEEDKDNINNGYPILSWQRNNKKIT